LKEESKYSFFCDGSSPVHRRRYLGMRTFQFLEMPILISVLDSNREIGKVVSQKLGVWEILKKFVGIFGQKMLLLFVRTLF